MEGLLVEAASSLQDVEVYRASTSATAADISSLLEHAVHMRPGTHLHHRLLRVLPFLTYANRYSCNCFLNRLNVSSLLYAYGIRLFFHIDIYIITSVGNLTIFRFRSVCVVCGSVACLLSLPFPYPSGARGWLCSPSMWAGIPLCV
jgi:hypothetical protein